MPRIRARAPSGNLAGFEREVFASAGFSHAVFRKGHGPAVLVIAEIPGITPHLIGFAERMVAMGCTVILPDLFGTAGRDPFALGRVGLALQALSSVARVCVSREFSLFALGQASPVVTWLRALAAREHERCGGPGVGVVGMCLTGGFALAMASDPHILAPVLSQPSLPVALSERHRRSIDCSDAELEQVAARCANEGYRVLGVRFKGDSLAPGQRFRFLKERLGEGFISVELPKNSGHPDSLLPSPHSVLTGDLIDDPGEPTRVALDQVLAFIRDRLIGASIHAHA
ncbi:MAG: hypothetical protein RL701_771 [Pseudomonadota bacterium]